MHSSACTDSENRSPGRPPASKRRLAWSLASLLLLSLAACAVLFFFDPARVRLYPVCYFHLFTGLQCPGCGGLRAAHQLLHGNLAAAFQLNPLVVLGAPVFAALCARFLLRLLRSQPANFHVRPAWLWIGLAVLVVFGIARNIFA